MKFIFNFIIVSIFIISCNESKQMHANSSSSIERGEKDKRFIVSKIDSINNVYLIYIERNDSVFKILSLKESTENCNTIIAGQKYDFKITSLFSAFFSNNPPVGLGAISNLNYHGTLVNIEDSCVHDLFSAQNVKGLCITPSNP